MSRAIRLSRIHAVNWYGYNDSLPVEGHLLLAGVTGSGKSVLMDLVQLVLVGSDRSLFNRSATGTTSDRTLKSYVLCDTKREENGLAQYVRDKGAICYVALEFTWPKNDRVETWGLRIEFRNSGENQGLITPWYCDGSLGKHDFLDQQRCPLELPAFRHLIKNRDGRTFETQEQFLRDMANDQHLNFNRAVLATLLPTAMSFTNLKSFDEFCRKFILPSDRLNIADVVASYKNFQAYERDLKELRDQFERLNVISRHFTEQKEATRDRVVARWLAAELTREHAQSRLTVEKEKLAKLTAEFEAEEKRIASLDQQITVRKSEIKQAQAAIHQMPGGADYLALKASVEKLNLEVTRLSETGNSVESALRARVKHARAWMMEITAAPLPAAVQTEALSQAIKTLDACDLGQTEASLKSLAEAAEQVKAEISRTVRPSRERLDQVRGELGRLREQITMLEYGIPPGPQVLLNSLNDSLPAEGKEPAARQLRDLCEVTDEKWRAAVEVAFTRKFSVVVPEQHYERALKIYQELRNDSPQESLVHPAKALKLARPVQRGSLAEKIQSDHPVCSAIISNLFGDVICVEKREDLHKHDLAILPDGFMTRGAFVERPRHYDNLPFVGKRGLQQQLAVKRSQAGELEAEERRLRPIVEAADQLLRSAGTHISEHTSILIDLARASELPARKQELEALILRLNSIDRASFEEKERQLQTMETELAAWEKELRALVGSQKRGEILHAHAVVRDSEEALENARRGFTRMQQEVGDISIYASRLKSWRDEMVSSFPALDKAARQFEREENEAHAREAATWEKLVAARRELALAYRKYEDLVPENPVNDPWEKLRAQIAEANIPDYQAKSEAARKQWETLFRNQVLSKLDKALRDVRDLLFLLNGNLKSPIGHDRYQIEARPNPEFKVYRDLISLNSQCQQDDLFFASVSGDLNAALQHFLTTLVEQPDSAEAARLLDYRHYFDYDLLVWDARDNQAKPVSVDRQSGKFSGGENQSPYFVAILASYLRAYNRHESRWKQPSLATVPIDEAFSKLSPERIEDCVRALKQLDLQGVLSMSAGNIPFAFSQCDQLIIVSKHEERRGTRSFIRNVPVSILRDSDEGQQWMKAHA